MVEFFIDLGVTYTQGVKLSLSYTNATNTSQTQEVLTSTVFSNGTNISHAECGGLVPFTKFTVEVRLMFSGSIYGPYNAAPGEHSKKTIVIIFITLLYNYNSMSFCTRCS